MQRERGTYLRADIRGARGFLGWRNTLDSEKRKHRRAVEDNRRPPLSPGTAENSSAPSHLLPMSRLFSIAKMLSFPLSIFLLLSLPLSLREATIFGGFPGNCEKAFCVFPRRFRKFRCEPRESPRRGKTHRRSRNCTRHSRHLFLVKSVHEAARTLLLFFLLARHFSSLLIK